MFPLKTNMPPEKYCSGWKMNISFLKWPIFRGHVHFLGGYLLNTRPIGHHQQSTTIEMMLELKSFFLQGSIGYAGSSSDFFFPADT